MTQHTRVREFSRSAVALAVCAAFAGAQAQEKKEEAKSPVETVAVFEAGAAGVSGDSKDRAFWGQYNGMRYQDVYGILNFDYRRLDTSTGELATWARIESMMRCDAPTVGYFLMLRRWRQMRS